MIAKRWAVLPSYDNSGAYGAYSILIVAPDEDENPGLLIGYTSREIAQHIVDLHNSWIVKKRVREEPV